MNLSKMIGCVECVEVEVARVSAPVALFMKDGCNNNLLLDCPWEHTV